MGSCLSKKSDSPSLNATAPSTKEQQVMLHTKKPDNEVETKNHKNKAVGVQNPKLEEENKDSKEVKKEVVEIVRKEGEREEGGVKKEIFVIKHRKSHDRSEARCASPQKNNKNIVISQPEKLSNCSANCELMTQGVVRTSSCTKEEVDAILIQCGRLSRSNSGVAQRKYSGSKRSFDFDHNDKDSASFDSNIVDANSEKKEECEEIDGINERRRNRQRSRPSSPSSQVRRRTPSRERERENRSGSRERGGSGNNARRVSRSPARRSENGQTTATATTTNSNSSGGGNNNRPAKMVSVPATVIDKSSNGVDSQAIKRISVKRNVGGGGSGAASPRRNVGGGGSGAASPRRNVVGGAGAASPRSLSPARTNGLNNIKAATNEMNGQQQQPSLSRSSSRKAEHSPYRRNPLNEIDPNTLAYPQVAGNKANNRVQMKNKEIDVVVKDSVNVQQNQATIQKQNNRLVAQGANYEGNNSNVSSFEKLQTPMTSNITMTAIVHPASEGPKPPALTRTRSSRRSRDLDVNPETLLNPAPSSYTALLLEDIQNFHQKTNISNNTPSFTLPACVTKACSILEAVADLNSSTSSTNLSSDKRRSLIVESEVRATHVDLMEPSLHKYVTVRRRGTLCEDLDGQESSGSNSFVGGGGQQYNWGYTNTLWEPNSADSTDRWGSSSNTREEVEKSPLSIQRFTFFETGHHPERTW